MPKKYISRFFLIVFSFQFLINSYAYCVFENYQTPDYKSNFLEVDKISLDEGERKALAVDLGAIVKMNQLAYGPEKKLLNLQRMIGLALKLDSRSKQAFLVDRALIKKKPYVFDQKNGLNPDKKEVDNILKVCEKLKEGAKPHDKKLRGYLLAILTEKNPKNDDLMFEYETLLDEIELDWDWVNLYGLKKNSIKVKSRILKSSTNEKVVEKDGFRGKNKVFQRKMATIKGLVVSLLPSGKYYGQAFDVYATATPKPRQSNTGTVGFARSVGHEMKISFNEAKRFVMRKYPFWESMDTRISFSDKYSPKDGGSAGTAFSLLMLSLLEGFEIQKGVAITGDITIDGKIRKVGGVGAKLDGAEKDGVKIVGIPLENEDGIGDILILYSSSLFHKVQVFTLDTIDDAKGLVQVNKDARLSEAIEMFDKVVENKTGNYKKYFAQDDVVETLEKIVKQAPNHVSAKVLLNKIKTPKTLSLSASMQMILSSANPIAQQFKYGSSIYPEQIDKGVVFKLRNEVRQFKNDIHPDIKKLCSDYVRFLDDLYDVSRFKIPMDIKDYKKRNAYHKKQNELINKARDNRNKVFKSLNQMKYNSSLIEKMMREGY